MWLAAFTYFIPFGSYFRTCKYVLATPSLHSFVWSWMIDSFEVYRRYEVISKSILGDAWGAPSILDAPFVIVSAKCSFRLNERFLAWHFSSSLITHQLTTGWAYFSREGGFRGIRFSPEISAAQQLHCASPNGIHHSKPRNDPKEDPKGR